MEDFDAKESDLPRWGLSQRLKSKFVNSLNQTKDAAILCTSSLPLALEML